MIEGGFVPYKDLLKKEVVCSYLGNKSVNKDGVVVTVKCRCNGKSHDVFHEQYDCGKYGRCLPTMDKPFDEKHELEASIYKLCKFCNYNKNNVNT